LIYYDEIKTTLWTSRQQWPDALRTKVCCGQSYWMHSRFVLFGSRWDV
jgi:hypothetical protein